MSDHTETNDRPSLGRRGFLLGSSALGVAGAIAGAAALGGSARADELRTQTAPGFEGVHQQGIVTPAPRASAYVAFDSTAATKSELVDLFRSITDQARALTAGGPPVDAGITAPPVDNGVLGPDVPSDGLTMTLSVGASLFDERYGLADLRPARLAAMSEAPFPNDSLRRDVCDGDLLLQLCAHNADTVLHALRRVMRATRDVMQVRWRYDGFLSLPRPSGAPRNLMGFKDGTSNPEVRDADLMERLVWTRGGTGGEPAWTSGGTYHVVRLIRMLIEFWDRVNIREQEQMIGRRRDSGAPNTGSKETDVPDFAHDPAGESIPTNAHIRLANPRTPDTDDSRILRRSYNYDGQVDSNGQLDMGLIFTAFCQDLDRQFVATQTRLVDEPLTDYIAPFGGGYYFALPGVRGADDWLGRGLLGG